MLLRSWQLARLSIPAIACGLLAVGASAQWGMGYNRGGYASTAGQAAAYGMSEMMRAQGYENMQNSEAAKNWEEAKTLEIQNRLRWTETYFDMRKENKERRADEAGPRVTQEQAIRMAKMAAPPRLGSTQLDPVTGHIEYPMILTDKVYTPYREQLDTLFTRRAESGGSIQYSDYQAIQTTVSDFVGALKKRVKEYAAGDYGKARTFLDSLAREASMPAG
ncbi:MAG: hypothetical protein K8S94_10880 [Planctomycetia bacterium]|nr:hypothetical protein [Planctomycetia bacterium]